MDPKSSHTRKPRIVEMPDVFDGAERKKRPAAVTIHRKEPEEVYAFFRHVANFPRFMPDVSHVEEGTGGVFRWVPEGDGSEWETEIVEDRAPECLAWRSREGSALPRVAAVTFSRAPDGRGTEVRFKIAFVTSAGKALGMAEKLRGGDPDTEAATVLRRFKALLETGEVPTVDGQPSGREEAEAA